MSQAARRVFSHPLRFALRVVRSFGRNQGILMAGAVAYYALLSVVPLLIVSVIVLSHWVDEAELLATLGHSLAWLVPSQSRALLADVQSFLDHRVAIGSFFFLTLLFFSSTAFSVLEKAVAIIFAHRSKVKKRHFLVSAVLPYGFVALLGVALLGLSSASIVLQTLSQESIRVAGQAWPLNGVSGWLLYCLGLVAEATILATLYLALPVGRIRFRHALVGSVSTVVLWEGLRHLLVWYFSVFSKVSIVYGSLTTAVVTLFGIDLAVIVFLLGAQLIAEYELLARPGA